MTSRERVLTAMDHRQPDRVPVDFGGTATSGMHIRCVAALREYYGLEKRLVKMYEPLQMLGWIDDDLAEALGVDTACIPPYTTIFGYTNTGWRPWRTPWNLEVLVPENFRTTTDAKGDLLIYPEGDTSVPPSGRMPEGGHYFDAIIRQEPIDEDRLDPADNLEEFQPISPEALEYFASQARRAAGSGKAVVATFGGTAFGDIALVPAPFLKRPRGIRDIAEWYMSTVERRDYIHKVFEGQCQMALKNLEKVRQVVGDVVDVVFVCGTDFGTQTSSFCSPQTFRELYMPYYVRINSWIHANTNWKTFKHCCGAVENFISLFIESGFDILNPVQCSAAGMDPRHLKKTYGQDIVFWGGGVDTQKVLPFGTPQQVREQVLERCEIFAPGGGFVFNTIHNVQPGTPVENIVAMFDALREFDGR